MKFLHYLIALPLLLIAAWAIYNAESNDGIAFTLWPYDKTTDSFNMQLILFLFLLYGYICGRVSSWFAHAPLRKALRQEKRANKNLTKEQSKLNQTVSGLQQNINNLQEQAKAQESAAKSAINKETMGLLAKIKEKFAAK